MDLTINVPPWAERIVSDLTDMDRAPRPIDPGLEPRLTLALPDDAYFEYAFLDAEGKMRADPDNPERADNPWYPEVSAVHGPDYRPDPLLNPPEPSAPPAVDRLRLESAALGQQRRLIVTTPAGHQADALPLVLVQDGVAFYRTGRLTDVLEALVALGEARTARLVYVEPIDRSQEYAYRPDYQAFIVDEVMPELRQRYPWNDELIAMGASLGGLFSASFGLEHPELVRTIVTLSGAFAGHPSEPDFYRSRRSWVAEALEAGVPGVPRWYAECGTLEWLTDVNRRVHAAVEGAAGEHGYQERSAGHNWTNWRNGLAAALRFALPPEREPLGG